MNLELEFTPDQLAVIAQWLEVKEEAGYTLSELIDEFTNRTYHNQSQPS